MRSLDSLKRNKSKKLNRWADWWDCIAPSRLTGLRVRFHVPSRSVPRWFISCRNAGPFQFSCTLPTRPWRNLPSNVVWGTGNPGVSPFPANPVQSPSGRPRDSGNSNEGYFTQSPVSEAFLKSLFWMHFSPLTSLVSFSLQISPSPSTYLPLSLSISSFPVSISFIPF